MRPIQRFAEDALTVYHNHEVRYSRHFALGVPCPFEGFGDSRSCARGHNIRGVVRVKARPGKPCQDGFIGQSVGRRSGHCGIIGTGSQKGQRLKIQTDTLPPSRGGHASAGALGRFDPGWSALPCAVFRVVTPSHDTPRTARAIFHSFGESRSQAGNTWQPAIVPARNRLSKSSRPERREARGPICSGWCFSKLIETVLVESCW
jgi:hypothetical protein